MDEPQAVEHFCLKCGKSIGTFVPLTEEEKDAYSTIQVCMDCYYDMYPYHRPPKQPAVTLVRWPRKRGGYTCWHRSVATDADAHGRTQCGLKHPRRGAEFGAPDLVTGHRCVNCERTRRGTVPGQP